MLEVAGQAQGIVAAVVQLLAADATPVSPVWGALNAVMNAATLVAVALIYSRRR